MNKGNIWACVFSILALFYCFYLATFYCELIFLLKITPFIYCSVSVKSGESYQ
jgi:hypothetical protein